MSTVDELVARQRQGNTPELQAQESEAEPPATRIARLLDAMKNAPLHWESFDIVLADEAVDVSLARLPGREWCDLESRHAPTGPRDAARGYDSAALARAYSPARIQLAGEPTTAEQWQSVYDLLDPEDLKTIQAVIWWLNVGETEERRRLLLATGRPYDSTHARPVDGEPSAQPDPKESGKAGGGHAA
jgi:hypothetical protein